MSVYDLPIKRIDYDRYGDTEFLENIFRLVLDIKFDTSAYSCIFHGNITFQNYCTAQYCRLQYKLKEDRVSLL